MPNCCSKVDDSRHGDSITQSRALAAFVSLSLKARRLSGVKPEAVARHFCCFKALHPLCLENALCCLLWEHCCRWGLLTELKLSFHGGGMEEKRFVFARVYVCVCVSLCLSSPSPHPHLSAPDTTPHLQPSSSQYELTFFISLLLYSCCDVGQGWVGEQLKIRQDRTLCMHECAHACLR